ncbi:hypothetical protein PC9H_007331 [Pleurotus ostreatus]|uniref:Uncharacterized protein n=1 Tax=Pleurotus ostreatus TaxID=5322 RepID=A0A8H6ZXY4_PLEOS|nr:uncharacterized protein PC9H_007331 [Pleurotus ostreatus]KAF7428112.1 hypothetical protein PC9H_007331 [Pleurotus ostreatus]
MRGLGYTVVVLAQPPTWRNFIVDPSRTSSRSTITSNLGHLGLQYHQNTLCKGHSLSSTTNTSSPNAQLSETSASSGYWMCAQKLDGGNANDIVALFLGSQRIAPLVDKDSRTPGEDRRWTGSDTTRTRMQY